MRVPAPGHPARARSRTCSSTTRVMGSPAWGGSRPFAVRLVTNQDSESLQAVARHLGEIALRGERGVLQIPSGDMLRQRWNPFHPYVEKRRLEFTGLE